MKKTGFIILFTLLTLTALIAEGQKESSDSLKIGISQFVQHPALDSNAKGIMDEMAALGYENIEYDLQNANGDINTTKQIASLFKSKGYDMTVGIATPSAQSLRMTIRDSPIVYSLISDPVSAGLVNSLEAGEAGICGTSHEAPVRDQLLYLMDLIEVKTLGQVYTGGEDNALFHAKQTEKIARELGLEYIGVSVANSSEVKSATESLMGRVDAIYVATDNTVVSALSGLTETANKNKVPVLSADPSSARENPVMLAWGFDWYYIGQETARLMDKVLKGTPCEELPTVVIKDTAHMDMIINTAVADLMGITFPAEDLERAEIRTEL